MPARRDPFERSLGDADVCRRKTSYATKARAVMAGAPHHRDGLVLRAYKCPLCRRWHLTKQPLRPTG